MIDAEVVRLRRLRDAALRTRRFALALAGDSRDRNSLFSRTAVVCWRMASIATGRLGAHPNVSCQRGPTFICIVYDRALSVVAAVIARYRDTRLRTLAAQLRQVERELNDTRALTWLLDLSDTLGRSQAQLQGLIKETGYGALKEAGSPAAAPSKELLAAAGREDGVGIAGDWPYLALQRLSIDSSAVISTKISARKSSRRTAHQVTREADAHAGKRDRGAGGFNYST